MTRTPDTFKRVSFLCIDRESGWDLTTCVFVTVFAANECSSDLETAKLLSVSQLGIKCGQLSVQSDDPINVTATECCYQGCIWHLTINNNNNNKTLFIHRQIRDCCPVHGCVHTLR